MARCTLPPLDGRLSLYRLAHLVLKAAILVRLLVKLWEALSPLPTSSFSYSSTTGAASAAEGNKRRLTCWTVRWTPSRCRHVIVCTNQEDRFTLIMELNKLQSDVSLVLRFHLWTQPGS